MENQLDQTKEEQKKEQKKDDCSYESKCKALMILRVAVFGEFLGHGVFALQGKAAWVGWIEDLLSVSPEVAIQILFVIGIMDIIVAFIILFKPIRAVILWAAIWGLWTAILRPIVGDPIWDFVERSANWGAPLALLYLRGIEDKKDWREWCR